MRKAIPLLALIVCLSLSGCGPDIYDCVKNADEYMDTYIPNFCVDGYMFYGSYETDEDDEKIYFGVITIDQERVYEVVEETMGKGDKYIDLAYDLTAKQLDNDTENITYELSQMKNRLEDIFKGTDVTVITVYLDRNDEITVYLADNS